MDEANPCTCIMFPGALKEVRVYDPMCNGNFMHRVIGSYDDPHPDEEKAVELAKQALTK